MPIGPQLVVAPGNVLHAIAQRAHRCQQQQAEIEAFIDVLSEIWEERFPEEAFKMPEQRQARGGNAIEIDEGAVKADLESLKSMGFEVGNVTEPKTADQRGELEGVADR